MKRVYRHDNTFRHFTMKAEMHAKFSRMEGRVHLTDKGNAALCFGFHSFLVTEAFSQQLNYSFVVPAFFLKFQYDSQLARCM